MEIITAEEWYAYVRLNIYELYILQKSLNEICCRFKIDHFEERIGVSEVEVLDLMDFLAKVYREIMNHDSFPKNFLTKVCRGLNRFYPFLQSEDDRSSQTIRFKVIDSQQGEIILTSLELQTLANALRVVLHEIESVEFMARIGTTEEEAAMLMNLINESISSYQDSQFWECIKSFDSSGEIENGHYNKITQQYFETPHVHDPCALGGIRYPELWEIPK